MFTTALMIFELLRDESLVLFEHLTPFREP